MDGVPLENNLDRLDSETRLCFASLGTRDGGSREPSITCQIDATVLCQIKGRQRMTGALNGETKDGCFPNHCALLLAAS